MQPYILKEVTDLASQKLQLFESCASKDPVLDIGGCLQVKTSKARVEDTVQDERQGARSKPTDLSVEGRRKLTYAMPQLKEAKQPIEKQPKQALPVPSDLTKSQRKNWRRSQKRKEGI